MCGLFGIRLADQSAHPGEGRLWQSAETLSHRGPDALSVYAASGIGLAHARLSLVDTDERSNQPFWDETKRYCIVFNGEIYNFQTLKSELVERGVAFHTTSDTEVLLKALIHGDVNQVLESLEGMFAFALYDAKTGDLLLARDRFGMKPLFICESDNGIMFASEVKAFRPWQKPEVDPYSLASYLLQFRGATKGFTLYDGIKSVDPGGVIRIDANGEMTRDHYTSLQDFLSVDAMHEFDSYTPRRMVDHVDALLTESVRKHMFADAAVGAFCSGGVDSSLLMAMAAQTHTDLAIFHANIVGPWSELGAAKELSNHLRLDLKAVDVEEQDFVDYIPRVIKHFEAPVADRPNTIPLMLVAQLAKDNGVKGLLSGEGSDECFLGYPWLGRKQLTDTWNAFGGKVRSVVHKVPKLGPIIWPMQSNNAETVRGLLNRREIAGDERKTREALAALSGVKVDKKTGWTLDYLHHHLRMLLLRNDTMGMAGSIEARFPFLDNPVVHTAVNMPSRYKLRFSPTALDKAHPFTQDKWVVRKVADRYLNKSLSQRPKFGFWTTVFQRMQISPEFFVNSYVGDLLELTNKQIADIMDEGDQDIRLRLLHLDIWGRVCIDGNSEEDSVMRLRDHVSIKPL